MKRRRYMAIFLAMLVLYPLSLGPAARLQYLYYRKKPPTSMRVIYAPLFWMADRVPWINYTLFWYAQFWLSDHAADEEDDGDPGSGIVPH